MRYLLLLYLFYLLNICGFAHTTITASLSISKSESQLFVKATLSKTPLTKALGEEGDCEPAQMLEKCGEIYFKKNITFSVNDKETDLKKVTFEVSKTNVIFQFSAPIIDTIKNIKISNTYMLAYDNHSIVKVYFNVNNHSSSYNLSQKRKSISVDFNE